MTGFGTALKEFINPAWVRHPSVPPLEAGLRPNERLDSSRVVVGHLEIDDMAQLRDGRVALTHGPQVLIYRDGEVQDLLATMDGRVTALAALGDRLVAAVTGVGLVNIDSSGLHSILDSAERYRSCVTALHMASDGSLYAAIGSDDYTVEQWKHALVTRDRSGSIVRVKDGNAVARRLAWPAGICGDAEGDLVVSEMNAHSIRHFSLSTGTRSTVLSNLPAYPGRITADGSGWLVAFPYVRNRLSELLLEERKFVDEMTKTIDPDDWMVPSLSNDNPFTSALQLGQLRVLGTLKPWAPARSYGLVAQLDQGGRFSVSYHSRVDGLQHGVTSAVNIGEGLLVSARGSRNLLVVAKESS